MPSENSAESRLISKFGSLIRDEKLHHAYIFEGALNVDKPALARRFAKAMLCENEKGRGCDSCKICTRIDAGTYEDLFQVAAEGVHIKDEAIEQLQEKLKKKPIAGDRNLVIIRDADRMTVRAQNRFLKSLEEPAAGTVIVLLSENRENLLQTIRSRCNVYSIEDFDDGKAGELGEAERLIEMLESSAKFYEIKAAFNDVFTDRSQALQLLDKMELVYRNKAVSEAKAGGYGVEDIFEFIHLIEETKREIGQEHGLVAGYAMKRLVISIGG